MTPASLLYMDSCRQTDGSSNSAQQWVVYIASTSHGHSGAQRHFLLLLCIEAQLGVALRGGGGGCIFSSCWRTSSIDDEEDSALDRSWEHVSEDLVAEESEPVAREVHERAGIEGGGFAPFLPTIKRVPCRSECLLGKKVLLSLHVQTSTCESPAASNRPRHSLSDLQWTGTPRVCPQTRERAFSW